MQSIPYLVSGTLMKTTKNEKIILSVMLFILVVSSLIIFENINLRSELNSNKDTLRELSKYVSIAAVVDEEVSDVYYNQTYYSGSSISFDDCFDEKGVTDNDSLGWRKIDWNYFNSSKCILIPQ